MRIPLPCKFGEKADCEGRVLPLSGVFWFKWSWGMEYTYFFSIGDKWHGTRFYSTLDTEQPFGIDLPDSLLIDKSVKEHGYPLKGSGYADEVCYRYGKTYIDFVMTSSYQAHIRVQCDEKWECVPNGDIIFPPSWDMEEKRNDAVLRAYRSSLDKAITGKEPAERQLSIYDFVDIQQKGVGPISGPGRGWTDN